MRSGGRDDRGSSRDPYDRGGRDSAYDRDRGDRGGRDDRGRDDFSRQGSSGRPERVQDFDRGGRDDRGRDDRGRDDRGRDDRGRDDRGGGGRDDRGSSRDPYDTRSPGRGSGRDADRRYGDDPRDDRDRGVGRDYGDRGGDRGRDYGDRGGDRGRDYGDRGGGRDDDRGRDEGDRGRSASPAVGGGTPRDADASNQAAAEKWERLMRSNVIVPSPGPPGYDPKSGRPPPKRDTVPYRLTLRGVSSLRVPERVSREADNAGARISHRISASLFDTTDRRFFGRTWEGSSVPLRESRSVIDVDHDIELYFHSAQTGGRCVLVLEQTLIVEKSPPSEHAVGWAILEVFDRTSSGLGALKDVADSGRDSGRETSRVEFYSGTPLALLQPELSPPYRRNRFLKPSQAQLSYALRGHRQMRPLLHALPVDVFTTAEEAWPGLLPSREPGRDGRLILSPFAKPETRSLQTACRLTAASVRLALGTALESETAKAAYAAMLPPPRGGAKPTPVPSSGLTTGQRRLLVGLHSSHALLAPKSVLDSREGPPVSSADGRTPGAPPGSLVAPKVISLETDSSARAPAGAPAGTVMLRAQASSSAVLEGFVLHASVALVFELQTEVTTPNRGPRRWISVAWGCAVLTPEPTRPPNFPQRLRVQMAFGCNGKPCPLSLEKLPDGGSALKTALPAAAPTLELEVSVPKEIDSMRKELDSQEADDATALATKLAEGASAKQAQEVAAAEQAFNLAFTTPEPEPEQRPERDDKDRDRRDKDRDDKDRDRRDKDRGRDQERDKGRDSPKRDKERDVERDRDKDRDKERDRRDEGKRDSPKRDKEADRREKAKADRERDDKDRDRRDKDRDDKDRDRRDRERERDKDKRDSPKRDKDDERDRDKDRVSPKRDKDRDEERERDRDDDKPRRDRDDKDKEPEPSAKEIAQERRASSHHFAKMQSLERQAYRGWREIAAIQRHSKPLGRIDLHVHSLKLVGPVPAHFDQFWLQLRPLVTTYPLRTNRVARPREPAKGEAPSSVSIDYAESLELLPSAAGTTRLQTALQPERSEAASTLTYVLYGIASTQGTVGEPLAEAQLPLRGLWSSGADVVRSALPLFAPDRTELAEISVTVHALAAIRAVTAPPVDRAAAAKAELAARGAKPAAEGRPVEPGTAPSRALVRSSAEQAMAELVAAGGGGYHEARVISTMPTGSAADRADRAMLWKASMHLGRTALDGAAAAQAGVPVVEDAAEWAPNMAHNLLVQFVCFSASGESPPPESIYLSFQLYHFAPRTTPRAMLLTADEATAHAAGAASAPADAVSSSSGRRPRGSSPTGGEGGARPDALVLEVRDLSLSQDGRDAPYQQLLLEIEIAGVHPLPADAAGAPPLASAPIRTPYATKRGRRVDFGFSHSLEVPPASAAAVALLKALKTNEPGRDAVITFTLKAPSGGRAASASRAGASGGRTRDAQSAMTDVASGTIDLQQLLTDNVDAIDAGVPMSGTGGFVGTLTVSVKALAPILALQKAERAQAAAAPRAEAAEGAGAATAKAAKERDLMLVAADAGLAREGPGLVERFLVQPPAAETEAPRSGTGDAAARSAAQAAVASRADGEAFAAVQTQRLQSYLQNKAVAIDVWDGASLLQIGTARVPLAALLKKGTERVGPASVTKEYLSVDVLDTALTSIDLAPSADVAAVVEPRRRGKLKLVIARLSCPVQGASSGSSPDQPLHPGQPSRALAAAAEVGAAPKQKVRTRALTDASDPNVPANVPKTREPTAAEEASLYRRQLRRQKQREWLRSTGGRVAPDPGVGGGGALGGAGQPLSRSADGFTSLGLAGRLAGAAAEGLGAGGAGSVARSLELGLSDEHSFSRARLQLQQRSLKAAEAYRAKHREERLRLLLQDQASLTRYVYPSYGSAELVELPFRNPYAEPHAFTIDWDDALGHLSLVTAVDEWRALKAIHGLSTPSEENLLLHGRQLWLQAHELVYIPIKYQGWQHGQVALHGAPAAAAAAEAEATSPTRGRRVVAAAALSPAEVAAQPLGKRTLIVRVLNVQSETVGALELRVRPQPYVVDQTFRFHQSEHEFLKTTIRMASVRWHASSALPHHLPAQHGGLTGAPPPTGPTVHGFSAAAVAGVAGGPAASAGGGAPPPVWVRSSDPNVVCGVHEQRSASQPLEVSIKFKCGSSPTVTRFLVLVYADVWMHTILETWELIVHALQRVDVHALMGQSSIAKAMLRGDGGNGGSGSRGLVQCFSSAPAELKLSPNAPFALTGGLTEVTLALRPHVAGRRQYVVHAVDLSRRALLASWLVCAVNRQPAITKAFELQVPAALGARKKVALSNPYAYDATFHFSTDKPHLLAFSAPSLSIPSQEAKYIGLHFSPLPSGGVSDGHTRVLVFVNNEEDKNEECMEITLKYVGA